MDGQEDSNFGADFKLLIDFTQKILTVEERIEEKLDAILAGGSSALVTNSNCSPILQKRPSAHDSFPEPTLSARSPALYKNPSSIGFLFSQRSDTQSPSIRSDVDAGRPSGMVPGWGGGGVQMRRTFQLLVEEQTHEDGRPSTLGRLVTQWPAESELMDNVAVGRGLFSDYIPISPNSPFLLCWTSIAIILLVAELTYVPFVLAWDIDTGVTSYCTVVFWTSDIVVNFISGTYNADGEENPIQVSARAYAVSWFSIDTSVVLLDWIGVFNLVGSSGVKLFRITKFARMWRMLAILRFSKLNRAFNALLDKAPFGNGLRFILRVVYLCLSILWFLHVVACFWYLIGRSGPTDTGKRWLEVHLSMSDSTTHIDVQSQAQYFQYMLCFHWSVATFTLGNMEVGYANSFERVFGVAFLVLSFLFGSVLISLLSALFVDHQTEVMDTTVKLRIVDRFLSENEVSNTLALRIQRVCLSRVKVKEKLAFSQTVALQNLPAYLYKDLCYDVKGRFLRQHDLFNCWSTFDETVAKAYSVDGVEMIFLKAGDELFKGNTDSENAFFFSSGELTYSKSEDDLRVSKPLVVPEATWLSEAALWSHWRHVGSCEAFAPCKVAVLGYKSLAQHVQGNRLIRVVTLSYCQLFCQGIALARPPTSEFPDDMCVPLTKFAGMLMHFPNEVRVVISTQAIKVSSLGSKSAAKLQAEVEVGKCDAYINIEGELERTALVMVLVLQDDEGHVLYQVGELVPTTIVNEDGREERQWIAKPELKLPGLKQDRGELLEDTLSRLVNKRIQILKDRFEHVSTCVQEEVGYSREFGVKTRYLRTKMVCILRREFPAKTCDRDVIFEDRLLPFSKSLSFAANPSPSRWRENAIGAIESVGSTPKSLYLIFEGEKPLIYAWFPPEVADTVKQLAPYRRDEVLNQMLRRINVDVVEEGPYHEVGLLV